ncbi:AAA family ATPase [Tenggerimyces flavus]|uniref:AAA family ATPase n=1 Tax=Tenggerimyces flavus TaxID=1708749 RepID=A0ABV7YGR7_9ACTN|nr:AAA family ATPase [Tenggerimyces flavus]MBM7784149.1 KaiC/GvpD/RAD55 family RecA-like ATPase [Tenggerimyces flavus]
MGLERLYVVAGAPGVGKTTLLPALVAEADGEVVFDTDELLEDGSLIGVPIATMEAAPIWPAYNRMWERIINAVRRAGHPVIFLSAVPDEDELTADVHWAGLDCADALRRTRLEARGWVEEEIEDAMVDAKALRSLIAPRFDTDDQDASALARRILQWVRKNP